jgi:hypothetical protein
MSLHITMDAQGFQVSFLEDSKASPDCSLIGFVSKIHVPTSNQLITCNVFILICFFFKVIITKLLICIFFLKIFCSFEHLGELGHIKLKHLWSWWLNIFKWHLQDYDYIHYYIWFLL